MFLSKCVHTILFMALKGPLNTEADNDYIYIK